ncbi:MAG: hypothetical protein MUE81_20315 [Thermoflexibacter sp.]|jgi:hypothetical protein|nr:hypothetical protein [Thermoflexibacter sp.]
MSTDKKKIGVSIDKVILSQIKAKLKKQKMKMSNYIELLFEKELETTESN